MGIHLALVSGLWAQTPSPVPAPASETPEPEPAAAEDPAPARPVQEWYSSDSLGFPIARIGWYRMREFEWTLRRDHQSGSDKDVLTLFQNGDVKEKTERSLYSNGLPKSILTFREDRQDHMLLLDPLGKTTTEIFFENGEEKWIVELVYRGFDLLQTVWKDGERRTVFTDRFYRGAQGRLRRVVRTFEDGSTAQAAWVYGPNGLSLEWSQENGTEKSFAYNALGLLTGQALYQDNGLKESKSWIYKEKELTASAEANIPDQTEIKRYFGEKGVLIREETYKKGEIVAETGFEYASDGTLDAKERQTGRLRERWSYKYDSAGKVAEETYEVNGQIDTVSAFSAGEEIRQDLYFQGEKVLELHFMDGEKVLEVFFRDGKKIRERDPREDQ